MILDVELFYDVLHVERLVTGESTTNIPKFEVHVEVQAEVQSVWPTRRILLGGVLHALKMNKANVILRWAFQRFRDANFPHSKFFHCGCENSTKFPI